MLRHPKPLQRKSRTHEVSYLYTSQFCGDVYEVTSGASGNTYRVSVDGTSRTCSCKWAEFHPTACSHIVAVEQHLASQAGRHSVSVWASREDALRQHRPVSELGPDLFVTSRKAA